MKMNYFNCIKKKSVYQLYVDTVLILANVMIEINLLKYTYKKIHSLISVTN